MGSVLRGSPANTGSIGNSTLTQKPPCNHLTYRGTPEHKEV